MHTTLDQLKQNHLQCGGGLVSVCSAHPLVLQTAMQMARDAGQPLLIEATAHQVNQFGGYTGMTPAQYAAHIRRFAARTGLEAGQVILGADHLGPWVWRNEPAEAALAKAAELLRQCIRAGFEKIHLDTTQGCADDARPFLPIAQNARRSAELCRIAESMAGDRPPLYVIGSDVPLPGGGLEEGEAPVITDPERMSAELEIFEQAFLHAATPAAWQRVMAMVVQPGVDFGDDTVAPYRSAPAAALSAAHQRLPGRMTFEIHAADYQTPPALGQMVRDHFILLKVGPCITFALRRALYALAAIEAELPDIAEPSRLPRVMETLMTERPGSWQSHYRGTPERLRHLRHNSLRDRIRYYWQLPEARNAVERLMKNLQRPLPPALLHHHLPELTDDIRANGLDAHPEGIAGVAIRHALTPYFDACRLA